MTTKEAITALMSLSDANPEQSHIDAERILLEFLSSNGMREVAETYEEVRDEIGFWYA